MNDPPKALQALRATLPGRVFTDEASRFRASVDNLRLSFMPEAVVRPREEGDVGALLRLASEHEVAVTPRGAGSSPTGSAAPLRGGWSLDLTELTELSIDPVARMATVGAGVVTATLQSEASQRGLFYPPDPSSKRYSTLGGNIACNAGGMRCLKYGVTRDYVVALRGFMADGSFVRWGLPLKKNVSGYNIRDLWIGSEGTLGVVTGATVKLVGQPEHRWTGMFAFDSETAALDGVLALLREGVTPSILEFIDRRSVGGAERFAGEPIFPGVERPSVLLVEVDGDRAAARAQRETAAAVLGRGAAAWREAADESEAEAIWNVRRTCSQAMFQLGDTKLNEDVVVPLERQAELVAYALQLDEELGLPAPTFGHAGDGNLHVHVMYHRADPEESARAKDGIERLMRKVVELGGVITGEHGIGLAKSPFLRLQHSDAEIEAMRSVKRALDPKGILNPGKIFDPFEVWEREPVEVTMPWDRRP